MSNPMPKQKIKIIREPIDNAGYAFRYVVKRGKEVLGEFIGNQLNPGGMSIGAAERAANECKRLAEEQADV